MFFWSLKISPLTSGPFPQDPLLFKAMSIFTFLLNPLPQACHILPLKTSLIVLLPKLISPSWISITIVCWYCSRYIQMSPEFHTSISNDLFNTTTWMIDRQLQLSIQFSSVQSLSCVLLFATPWTSLWQASLSIINSWSLLKLMFIESMMPSNHLILCRLLLFPPSIIPSIRVFSSELVLCIRWPKYWSFSFSISPSNEYSGLISFRMDWLDLLAVQGTLKSLFQHHSSKASVLQLSTFFIVQLSHSYMTTGKTKALTRWTFVGKVMSLLFNMLSRLVITFLPRSKRLLISWLQSPSAVILEPPKIKFVTVSQHVHN